MEQTVQILIKNNGQTIEVPMGAQLEEVYQLSGLQMEHESIYPHTFLCTL